jgi:AraC family transcriptional regulator, regulatory protein of adaptative response / methylated-DNA-[protein]-cysteine methyltransferase
MKPDPSIRCRWLAARLGMSPAHFQRVFSQWVGVSPKRYQQYLALGHARRLLAERFTVLEAALARGCRPRGGCTTSSCGGRR